MFSHHSKSKINFESADDTIAPNKFIKLKTNLKNLLSDSTSHGLPKIVNSERVCFKLMWLLSLVVSTSVGFYLIVSNIFDYLDYEVVTKIQIINESLMPFPTVTFYNLNNVKINDSLDDILIFCNFNNEDCSAKDFRVKIDDFTTVYQFNSNGLKKSYMPGSLNSLRVHLFAGFPSNFNEKLFQEEGFHVNVHNFSTDPEYVNGFSFAGIKIPIGFITHIIANRIFTHKLEKPYSNCIRDFSKFDSFDSFIYDSMQETTNYTYRQKDCIHYCIAKEMMVKCNITGILDRYDKIWNDYWTSENSDCLYRTYKNSVNKNLNEFCANYCPLECISNTFQIATSISNFPNSYGAFTLIKNKKIIRKFGENYTITQEDLRKTMIGFEVYYDELKYTKISEVEKVKVVDLIANIGGVLGLFIGVSFLSLVEILELILEMFFVLNEN